MNHFKIDGKDELFWVVIATFLVAGLVASTINLNGGLRLNDADNQMAASDQARLPDVADSQKTGTTTPKKPAAGGSGTDSMADQSLSYQEAKDVFEYRFQFDKDCHSTTGLPTFGTINVKQGAGIMLENHGDETHTLALGNDAHKVKAGGFVIVKAPTVTKPTGLYVTCDGGGAGNLFVYP